jgi:uncharacterized protein
VSEQSAAVIAQGFAKCEKPDRYIQQLVSHWGHKYPTSYADGVGTFPFSDLESAVMGTQPDGIGITLTTPDHERSMHMRGVIERHIDRFAFREAPLSYDWKEA